MNILTPASKQRKAQHLYYRRDIDGLRAIAIVPVVAFHAFPELFPGGFVGVDIFFVISGFLITSIVAREIENEQFSLGNFYARRVKRIFPALLSMLTATIAVGWFLLLDGELHQFMWHVFAGATFWQNIALFHEAGYFDRASEMKPLLHLWSLAVEEQFYIVLPLLLLAVTRLKGQRAGMLLIGLCLISFCWGVHTVGRNPEKAFYMPHLRAWELLVGSSIALWPSLISSRWHITLDAFRDRLPSATANALGAGGLLAIAVSVVTINKADGFPGWVALFPVLGAASVIIAGDNAWSNRAILGSRPMVYIGLISFPLYLWHWPILVYLRLASGTTPPVEYQLAAVAVAVGLAVVTYKLIEAPLRRSGGNTARIVRSLAGLMAAVAVLGMAGSLTAFDLPRPRLLSDNAKNFTWDGAFENGSCRKRYNLSEAKFCNLAADTDPTVALVGDSHALVYYAGLASALLEKQEILLNVGGPSCMPAMKAPFHSTALAFRLSATCTTAIDKAYEVILRAANIHTVVLSGRRFTRDLSSQEVALVYQTFDASIRALKAAAKRVVIVLDFPEPSIDPATCIRPLALIDKPNDCWIDRAAARRARQSQEDLIRSLLATHPDVVVHDPFEDLCEGQRCPITAGGRSIYRDLDHLSPDGSKIVARRLSLLLRRPSL